MLVSIEGSTALLCATAVRLLVVAPSVSAAVFLELARVGVLSVSCSSLLSCLSGVNVDPSTARRCSNSFALYVAAALEESLVSLMVARGGVSLLEAELTYKLGGASRRQRRRNAAARLHQP